MHLDEFGCIRVHLGAFGYIWVHLRSFGCIFQLSWKGHVRGSLIELGKPKVIFRETQKWMKKVFRGDANIITLAIATTSVASVTLSQEEWKKLKST